MSILTKEKIDDIKENFLNYVKIKTENIDYNYIPEPFLQIKEIPDREKFEMLNIITDIIAEDMQSSSVMPILDDTIRCDIQILYDYMALSRIICMTKVSGLGISEGLGMIKDYAAAILKYRNVSMPKYSNKELIDFRYNNCIRIMGEVKQNYINKTQSGFEPCSHYEVTATASSKANAVLLESASIENVMTSTAPIIPYCGRVVAPALSDDLEKMEYHEDEFEDIEETNKFLKKNHKALENMVFSEKDQKYNMDDWKPKKNCNYLYVTGSSGSGKSTKSKEIASYEDASIFILDNLFWPREMLELHKSKLLDTELVLAAYIREYIKESPLFKDAKDNYDIEKIFRIMSWKDYAEYMQGAHKYIMKHCASHPSKLFVIEGIHVYIYWQTDKNILNDIVHKPCIIKGTSEATSSIRRFRRDGKLVNILPTPTGISKAHRDNKMLDTLRDAVKIANESFIDFNDENAIKNAIEGIVNYSKYVCKIGGYSVINFYNCIDALNGGYVYFYDDGINFIPRMIEHITSIVIDDCCRDHHRTTEIGINMLQCIDKKDDIIQLVMNTIKLCDANSTNALENYISALESTIENEDYEEDTKKFEMLDDNDSPEPTQEENNTKFNEGNFRELLSFLYMNTHLKSNRHISQNAPVSKKVEIIEQTVQDGMIIAETEKCIFIAVQDMADGTSIKFLCMTKDGNISLKDMYC